MKCESPVPSCILKPFCDVLNYVMHSCVTPLLRRNTFLSDDIPHSFYYVKDIGPERRVAFIFVHSCL